MSGFNDILPYDFFKRVVNQKFVPYGDTDSLFINIPSIKPQNATEALDFANKISEEINLTIKSFNDNYLLPKMGVDPQYNFTEFKTEFVIDGIMFLDIKKNYAYRLVVQEGKILKTPTIVYAGLPIKKVDTSKFVKQFLKTMIDDVMLNPNIPLNQTIPEISKIAKSMQQLLYEHIAQYKFDIIGTPKKWGTGYSADREPWQVNAMKLYNTIIDDAILMPMSGALYVPIKIKDDILFNTKLASQRGKHEYYIGQDVASTSLNKIFVPYNYDSERVKCAFENYGIEVDPIEAWDFLFGKIIRRVIDVAKNAISMF